MYGYMGKDYLDSKRGNLLPLLHGLLLPISSKGSFICTISHDPSHYTQMLYHKAMSCTPEIDLSVRKKNVLFKDALNTFYLVIWHY